MNTSICRDDSHGYGLWNGFLRGLRRAFPLSAVLGGVLVTQLVGHSARDARADDAIPQNGWQADDLLLSDEAGTVVSDEPGPAQPHAAQDGLMQQLRHRTSVLGGREPLWVGSVDALMLWRGNISSVPIFFDNANSPVINANDTQPGTSAGLRFGLMRRIGDRHAIEGNYLQVEPFTANVRLPGTGAPFRISDLGGLPTFGDIATGTVATSGQIRSAELNWRTWNGMSVNWLAGFRWVEWNESMNIDYTFRNPDPYGTGSLAARTGNDLYGGQLGADVMLWNRGGALRVNALGKAGVFFNSAAYQRSSAGFTDEAGAVIPVGAVANTAEQTAFFGEIGLNTSFDVTRWLTWRLGYNVFWLSGVATAPQQFATSDIPSNTGTVNTQGSVLLHGVNTGIEARW